MPAGINACNYVMPLIRKILVSVKIVSAILGPEMVAPILWTPGKMRSFCRKTHVHKIPRLGGGVWGGGKCRFYSYGREDFSELSGTGDPQRDSRESFTIETPSFIARQANSPESLEFPIRANHPI